MRADVNKSAVLSIMAVLLVLLVSCPSEPIVHTVSFNTQGGSTVSAIDVGEGMKVQEPSPPDKSGFAFVGWFKESLCTTQWDFATDMVVSTMTLYAKWVPLHTVSFDSVGGSAVTALEVGYGMTVREPAGPTKPNYIFGGWYREIGLSNQWNFTIDTVASNITLYAKWLPLYTVSFNSQGGNAIPAIENVVINAKIAAPVSPNRDGYVFDGWYLEASCTTVWNFTTDTVVANITLYAKWLPLYAVSFNSQGGNTVPAIGNVVSGTKISKPSDPLRDGYVFDGWYREASCTTVWNFSTDTVVANITLYAKWYKHYGLGSIGPAGGYVFYDKGSYSDGWRYMEAVHESKEWVSRIWGGYGTIVSGTEEAVGTGEANTSKIITKYGNAEPSESSTDYAAKLCTDAVLNNGGVNYDDWFLPSIEELDQMYLNLYEKGIGGFSDKGYWSSTEFSNNNARIFGFNLRSKGQGPKSNSQSVRAIRTF